MPVYLELFHGRSSPTEELDDWGSTGPCFGPLSHVHTTYGSDIKLGGPNGELAGVLYTLNDLVYYDGVYYGDWSVFGEESVEGANIKHRLAEYAKEKAEPPGTVHRADGWRMIPTRTEG